MKINVWISDSGSSAKFSVDTENGKIIVESTGGMPVEKLASRVKTWKGTPREIKKRLEKAWNCDCDSAEFDPYEAEITNEDGEVLA